MKEFVRKFSKLFLIFIIASFVLSCIIYSFHVDYKDYNKNTIIAQKLDSLKSRSYNTIAFGSSSMVRFFNPEIFDSLISTSHSYNAGVPDLVPFRQFDYIREVFKTDRSGFDLILFEIINLDGIFSNYDKSTYQYSINFRRYIISLLYPFQIHSGYRSYPLPYSKLFFYKYLGFGIANHFRLLLKINSYGTLIPEFVLPLNNSVNGYISLDSMLNDKNKRQRNYYTYIRNQFLSSEWNNTLNLQKNFQQRAISTNSGPDLYSEELMNFLSEISKHTTNLILIIPPRSDGSKVLVDLKQKLLANGYILWDFSDPLQYPFLFQKEYSFDKYHLNGKGAELFTKILAEKYKSFLIDQTIQKSK